MTVAIMQPYFFPYIGYWQLIANSDEFIFFDVVQYNKRSWMNRNRILHPDKPDEFQYISIPIKKHSQGTLIKNVEINYDNDWKSKILGQLTVYKKLKAPYYNEIKSLLEQTFNNSNESFLSLSIDSTVRICKYLDIDFKYQVASKINFDRDMIKSPSDWAIAICNKLNANHYINPYSGYDIFDESKYDSYNIDIKFLKSNLTPYNQSWRKKFISGLSIIDILMFNDKETVKELIVNDFKKLSKEELIKLVNDEY